MVAALKKTNTSPSFSELSEFRVMEWLFWLRNLMILVQLLAMIVAVKFMDMPLPIWPISAAPLLLLVFNILVYWRLEKGLLATELEISLHLLLDMLVFTWLLYWTGGSVNPFVSAYLVPVAAAAAFGGFRYAMALGLVSVMMYSFLMVQYVPLPPMNGRFGGDFSLHIFGMWLSFLMSATITIGFVSAMAKLARQREIALKQAEQESINSQHMVALGALAAGAAHELGTPLSNIGMLADEINDPDTEREEIDELVESLKDQIGLCQSQIAILRDQANHAQNPESMNAELNDFVHGVLERFRAMRSEMMIRIEHHPLHGQITHDPALSQTLLNLLNNAADASTENGNDRIDVSYRLEAGMLHIYIDDFGAGLSSLQQDQVGVVPFTTKQGGMGIGLLLSHANINRIGGELRLLNREDSEEGGVRTEIIIPVLET